MANLVRCGARSRRGVACNTLLVHGQPPFELTDDNTEPVDRMCATCRARLDRRRVQERRNKQKCRQRSEADQTCQRCHRTKEQLAAAAIEFRMDSLRTCASCLETQRSYQRTRRQARFNAIRVGSDQATRAVDVEAERAEEQGDLRPTGNSSPSRSRSPSPLHRARTRRPVVQRSLTVRLICWCNVDAPNCSSVCLVCVFTVCFASLLNKRGVAGW